MFIYIYIRPIGAELFYTAWGRDGQTWRS